MTRAVKILTALAMAGASILCVTSQASADPNPKNHGSEPMTIQLRRKYGRRLVPHRPGNRERLDG
ncbi:hypothetical protein [Streptomyces durhamensis]|uniref:hypothetical protein n=1 Tax=Streptomyces durhamensis TaxID=68194 RepID=UPI001FD8352F|nr:hypothetical protein [Streptomyces durhamensis]